MAFDTSLANLVDLAHLAAEAYEHPTGKPVVQRLPPGWVYLSPEDLGFEHVSTSGDEAIYKRGGTVFVVDGQGYFSLGSNEAFVAYNLDRGELAVSFRGTTSFSDIATDILIPLQELFDVIAGMKPLTAAAADYAIAHNLVPFATGHSLGGALAEALAATDGRFQGGLAMAGPGLAPLASWPGLPITVPVNNNFFHVTHDGDLVGHDTFPASHIGPTIKIVDLTLGNPYSAHINSNYLYNLDNLLASTAFGSMYPSLLNGVIFAERDGTNPFEGTVPASGSRMFFGTEAADTITAEQSALSFRIDGGKGYDKIFGSDGADILSGGVGIDQLHGGGGSDTLRGDEGTDYLTGGAGDDTLIGGANGDLYVVRPSEGHDLIDDQGGGIDALRIYGGDVVTSIDKLAFTLFGANLNIRARDAGGNLVLDVTIQNIDSSANAIEMLELYGSNGKLKEVVELNAYLKFRNQPYSYISYDGSALPTPVYSPQTSGGFGVVLSGDFERSILSGTNGNDELHVNLAIGAIGYDGDDIIYGSDRADGLGGDGGNDTLFGGPGGDWLSGHGGDDGLFGGAGDDELVGDDGNDFLDGADGADRLLGYAGNDILFGGSGDDHMDGGDGENLLFGDEGNDRVQGGFENDRLFGGPGHDSMDGGPGNDLIDGGDGNDDIVGASGNDVIYGSGGDDVLSGWLGNDILVGGEGTDVVRFANNRSQYLIEYVTLNGASAVRVIALGSIADEGVDTIYSTEKLQFSDEAISLLLVNAAPAIGPTAIGPATAFTADAWTYSIPSGAFTDPDPGDVLTYSASLIDGSPLPNWLVFNPTTRTFSGTTPSSALGPLGLRVRATDYSGASAAQDFALTITLGPGPDLVGTTDADTITGTERAEEMLGGLGNDNYTQVGLGDIVTELPGEGIDSIQTALGSSIDYSALYFLPDNVENLELTGSGQGAHGNALNNTVTGSGGNDLIVLSGTAPYTLPAQGTDTVNAGAGDDYLFFGGSLDAADTIDGGSGYDFVGLLGNYAGLVLGATSFAGVERLAMYSSGNAATPYSYAITTHDGNVAAGQTLAVTAATLLANETLTFNGSAETNGKFQATGGRGADSLTGGAGNDRFIGGLGADTLTGGLGNDVFQYNAANESTDIARDIISGFTTGDRIDLWFVDANANAGGNQAFSWIGANAFSGAAGQLRATNQGSGTWLVEGDTDGDGDADISIQVNVGDGHAIGVGDFIL